MVGSRLLFFVVSLRDRHIHGFVWDRMEANAPSTGFDLTGTFGGFIFTANGKRRMLLQIADADCLFKVPRLLRRRVIGSFRSGQVLRVTGVEDRDGFGTATKRTVEQIIPANDIAVTGAPVQVACTIKVCAKKNCWRSGGRELLAALKGEAVVCGMADRVELKAVGCLDRCKQAPNADSPWREYRRCGPHDARAILAEIAHRLGKQPEASKSD